MAWPSRLMTTLVVSTSRVQPSSVARDTVEPLTAVTVIARRTCRSTRRRCIPGRPPWPKPCPGPKPWPKPWPLSAALTLATLTDAVATTLRALAGHPEALAVAHLVAAPLHLLRAVVRCRSGRAGHRAGVGRLRRDDAGAQDRGCDDAGDDTDATPSTGRGRWSWLFHADLLVRVARRPVRSSQHDSMTGS